MSHDLLDELRARHARTQSPRDASNLISALLRYGELTTLTSAQAHARTYGQLADHYEDRGYTLLGKGISSGIGIWRHHQLVHLMPSSTYDTYLLEWDLIGWQLTSRTSGHLLWEHDEPMPEDEFGMSNVETHAPVEQVCHGHIMAIPVHIIELPDPHATQEADTVRRPISVPSLRPDLDLNDDSNRFAADFGALLLPDLQALARPNVAPIARYGTLRLLATLLFDANPIHRDDDHTTRLEPTGDASFDLSCTFRGLETLSMDTSKVNYDATLTLAVTPTSWSFTRTVTFRDIFYGMALS